MKIATLAAIGIVVALLIVFVVMNGGEIAFPR